MRTRLFATISCLFLLCLGWANSMMGQKVGPASTTISSNSGGDFPVLKDTGNPEADQAAFQLAKQNWIAANPDGYKAMGGSIIDGNKNGHGVTVTYNESAPADPKMSWNLSTSNVPHGDWHLAKVDLQRNSGTVGGRSEAQVLSEISGDFPLNSFMRINQQNEFELGYQTILSHGSLGTFTDMLVFDHQVGACTDCSNRQALKILSHQGNSLVLGMEMQDEDTPYMIRLTFSDSKSINNNQR